MDFVDDATITHDSPAMASLLRAGELEVLGLMPWSSNGTYLVSVTHDGENAPAVYKPEQGERPLWDFPDGLWRREVASYELSSQLGFGLVPTTVARDDGPLGEGSLQAFVPARFSEHYFTIRDMPGTDADLRRLCAFDLVANSADRKGGHCLIDDHDRIWAIDNGLSFHDEFKVRTVLWDYAGDRLPEEVCTAVSELIDSGPSPELAHFLSEPEQEAMIDRSRTLLAGGHFPHDPSGRRYPWPLV